MSELKINMGKRLFNLRKASNLTQEEIAEMIDISTKHYSELERGKTGISIENIVAIHDRLGLSVDYLLFGEKNASGCISPELEALISSLPQEKIEKLPELLTMLKDF